MNEQMLAAKEISELTGKTDRAIRKRAKKEGWPFVKEKARGGKLRKYLVTSLPEDVRLAISPKPEVPSIYNGIPLPVGSPELADWQNKIALARADLIRQYVAEKTRAKSKKESVIRAGKNFLQDYNTGQMLPTVHGIIGGAAWQTVEAWTKTFRDANYNYMALAPAWGNRRGVRKVTDAEFNTVLTFALHENRLRISQICRFAKKRLASQEIHSPSSEDTLRRALQDWKKTHYDQWVFSREGKKALNDKCLPYIERDGGMLDVGDVLVADGHTLNFQARNPFTGKAKRMTMLMWYDWASCMPVGWEIMPTENIQCVAASLRRAIITLGKIPKVAYLDNGRAFKAKIFNSKEIDFEEAGFYGMFARLGMETIFAWPYNAQSKPVERFFGTFNEMERLMPTYTGASIPDKPARLHRNETLHRKVHEKKYGDWSPTIPETCNIIAGWVKEYAGRPHRGLKGICPGEVFSAGKGPGVDEQELRFLMMSMEIKSVRRNGINFMGRNYYDSALYGLKERVTIRYDLEDLSQILVYDITGAKLICEALPRQLAHPVAKLLGTKEDLELVKQGIKQKRALAKSTEAGARRYIEEAPNLIECTPVQDQQAASIPLVPPSKGELKVIPLTRAESEHIEAEAAKMTVSEIKDPEPDRMYMTEPDRYEALLEIECKNSEEMSLDDMTFMRYFEKTSLYRMFKDRFEFLTELFIAGPEEEVGQAGN